MVQCTQENGMIAKNAMVKAARFGLMGASMKDIGRMIKQMVVAG
jgi:hypothetical protein